MSADITKAKHAIDNAVSDIISEVIHRGREIARKEMQKEIDYCKELAARYLKQEAEIHAGLVRAKEEGRQEERKQWEDAGAEGRECQRKIMIQAYNEQEAHRQRQRVNVTGE